MGLGRIAGMGEGAPCLLKLRSAKKRAGHWQPYHICMSRLAQQHSQSLTSQPPARGNSPGAIPLLGFRLRPSVRLHFGKIEMRVESTSLPPKYQPRQFKRSSSSPDSNPNHPEHNKGFSRIDRVSRWLSTRKKQPV